jgi:hypothetical protein
MAITLHNKYRKQLTKALEYASVLSGKTSTEYEWIGVNEIKLTSIKTVPLTDYDRTSTGNRYGTLTEVEDSNQNLMLQKDRSVPLVVDKGNYQEQNMLKTAGAVIRDEMNEQVKPELETFALNEWAKNAGQYMTITDDDNGSAILVDLMKIEAALANARIPKTDRFVAVDANLFPYIRSALTNLDNVTDRMMFRGVVGRVGTLNIIEVPHSDMPSGVWALAWWKRAVVDPKTIEETKVITDSEFVSGFKINMRFRFGAFVIGKYAMGVVALLASGNQATAVTPTSARVLDLNSGDTVKYTLDGTDPRYSTTAITVVADTTISSTAAPVGTTIKAVTYNSAKAYPSDVKSVVVAS